MFFRAAAHDGQHVCVLCAHHVADVDPDAGEEGAEDIVADSSHKGQVLVGGQERAQHQDLNRHQAVQAGHHR